MLSPILQNALNEQINYEIYSAYTYLSMAAQLEAMDLPGMANWMKVQVQEELVHAMKFYNFVIERDSRVFLKAVQQPQTEWTSPLFIFDNAIEHEQGVTKRIYNLVTLAREEKDFAVENFLQWFITEQVEEEANVKKIIQQLKLVGKEGQGLFLIDRELGQRTFTPPPGGTQA